jgi:hypothetical protein
MPFYQPGCRVPAYLGCALCPDGTGHSYNFIVKIAFEFYGFCLITGCSVHW